MKQWERISFDTGEDYFNRTQTLFYLLVMVPMLGFALAYLEAMQARFAPALPPEQQETLLVGLPILSLMLLVLGFWQFFILRKEARTQATLRRKLQVLYRANTWKYLALAFTSMLIAVGMYLTQQEVMGAWMGILLFIWSLSVPTRQRFGRDLQLPREDRQLLVHKGEIPNDN